MKGSLEQLLGTAIGNPDAAEHELERLRCEGSLLEFIKAGWSALEPAVTFTHGWAVEAICEHLEAVSRGDIKRLLINVPPGCTKSMTTNVFWPAWEWGPGGHPDYRYINASYGADLSIRDNMRCRDLIQSDWYQSHWGDRFAMKGDQNAKILYENDKTGWRFAASVGKGITGRRGDRIIVDDPHSVENVESDVVRERALRWFFETLSTRFNKLDESALVVIMQRVHDNDLSGAIIAKDLGYEHLCLPMEFETDTRCYTQVPRSDGTPAELVVRVKEDGEPLPKYMAPEDAPEVPQAAEGEDPPIQVSEPMMLYPQDRRHVDAELLWPERFSAKAVEDQKKSFRAWGGTYAEAGQLQQRPVPRGGGMIDVASITKIAYLPEGLKVITWVRGWDLAMSDTNQSPWTVGAKLGKLNDGRLLIAHVCRFREKPGACELRIKQQADADGAGVVQYLPQDPGQSGKGQANALAILLEGHNSRFSPESGDKVTRAVPFSAQVEVGNVLMLAGGWNDALLAELGLFPASKFKDQMDAISRAYEWILKNRAPSIATVPGRMIK